MVGRSRELINTMFDVIFPLVPKQKSNEYGKEQHEKLPEIMGPFFSSGMRVMVYFHAGCQLLLVSYFPLGLNLPGISRQETLYLKGGDIKPKDNYFSRSNCNFRSIRWPGIIHLT
jgi:hypothetical protein